jgi:hypothetical protein
MPRTTPRLAAALLALICVSSLSAQASSGSWSNQPTWANSGSGASVSRKSQSRDDRYGISPFAPGSNNFALDVGQVFLMGDLASRYSDSIGAQIHYTYGVSELFGFDSSVGYSEHSDGKMGMLTALTGLRTNLAWYDKVVPYLVFGMGFYKPSFELASSNGAGSVQSVSPLLFGVHLGPGVDLELTKQLFFGAAITFHDVFGPTKVVSANEKFDVGGTYTSFFLHAGVTF